MLTPAEQRVLRAMDIEEVCNCMVSVLKICKKCDLFVFEFYGPVNNEVMSSRSVNSGIVPGIGVYV